MVTTSLSQKNRFDCYKVIQEHIKVLVKKEAASQRAHHLKAGRKASTFRYNPGHVVRNLVEMSTDVAGRRNTLTGKVTYKTTPAECMAYLANDGEFNYMRYG